MAKNKQEYYFYKNLGICVQCNKEKAKEGQSRCQKCLDSAAEYRRKKRSEMTDEQKEIEKQKKREHMRKLREEKKKNGICIWCKKPVSKYSDKFCIDCRVASTRRNRAKGITRSERVSFGICYICGKEPLFEDKHVCKQCYDKKINEAQKIINLPGGNHWRKQNEAVFKIKN